MLGLSQRSTARDPMFSRPVNLGDWSNDQDVPSWITICARLASQQLQASLLSAVHLVAQIKMTANDPQNDESSRLVAEMIDVWCGPRVPDQFPPQPHWSQILEQLELLAQRYSTGSVLHDAVFDLGHRIMNRVKELSKPSRPAAM